VDQALSDLSNVRRIASGHAQLATVRGGVGAGPGLVFLHAGIADHRSWNGVLELLMADTEVVAYDRRGFGTTSYEPEAHDQVQDLLAVLDGTGLNRAVVVGNSRGGQIALDFALAHPDRVSALVLVAPGVSGAPPAGATDVDEVESSVWAALEAADAAGDMEALNEGEIRFWLDGPHAPEGRVGGAVRTLALSMNRIVLEAPSPGYEPTVTDGWSRLQEVNCPVLLVVGDLDMGHLQRRCDHLAAHFPDARLIVMDGTAHLPALEQPEVFVEVLRQFLAERVS
jgi:pimeloyl-ACP methyl ester carboxylesterase